MSARAIGVLLAAFAAAARAEPLWEAGGVAGGGLIADYPGADQSHVRGLVVPVLIYRGRVLRVDRDGVRGRLFDHPDVELDLSASAAFDARSNDARQGMPGLDYLFGVGPKLIYKGMRRLPGAPELHLQSRALFSTDFHRIDRRGSVLEPQLRWRFGDAPGRFTVAIAPTWASRSLHRYFYEVEPAQATPARPAYRARSGYLGTAFDLTYSRRIGDELTWFAGLRSLWLGGAANDASPLLRRDWSASVGAGVVWTPWRSAARAVD